MNTLNKEIVESIEQYCDDHGYNDVEFIRINEPVDSQDFRYIVFKQNDKEIRIIDDYKTLEQALDETKHAFTSLFEKKSIQNIIKKKSSQYGVIGKDKEILTDECCICYENYTDNKVIFNCGHSVCKCCSGKIKICPYCRKDVSKDYFNMIKIIIKNHDDEDEMTLEEKLNVIFEYDKFIKNELDIPELDNLNLLEDVYEHIWLENGILFFNTIQGDFERTE